MQQATAILRQPRRRIQLFHSSMARPRWLINYVTLGWDSFVDYWQAHADRNWKRRYAIEKFPRALEEKFYVAYHANAWQLKSIMITGVQVAAKEATVDIVLTVVDPEKKTEIPTVPEGQVGSR
ncbi:MAG: hypothetical protein IPG23_12300 [Burkholderiales bacterium]|nr:hypothetical protein [Burkholderiales bacterium]